MHFIEKFGGENIDGQHLRPPVLAIPLETIERENFDGFPNLSIFPPTENCAIHYTNMYYCIHVLVQMKTKRTASQAHLSSCNLQW